MKWKQALIDLGVLMAVPALFFLGTTFILDGGDSSALLLTTGAGSNREYGTDVKSALDTLKEIDTKEWDVFFGGNAYQSLVEFPVDVAPVTLGREEPFTLPVELRDAAIKKSPSRTP